MTQAPLHWIQQIEQTLIDTKQIPLSGYSPPFPWSALSKKIADLFQCPGLTICLRQMRLLSCEDSTQGFGSNFLPLSLDLTPLKGQPLFLMGKEEIEQLSSLGLTLSHPNKGFLSPSFKEGFYYYLCTEAVLTLNELHAFGDLALKIGKAGNFPQEESLCIDIEILHSKHSFFARIVCPASFHLAFKEHFHERRPPALNKNALVNTAITIGQTEISITEWENLHVGDFISLDRCTFDPHTKKGTALLCLENTPILRLRIKEDHLKIINYATYHEEQHSMDPKLPPPNEDFNEEEEFSSPEVTEETNGDHLWSSETTRSQTEEAPLISASQIPMTLIIEVGRMTMNLEELLNLSPGNTLELQIKPEQGVDITLQGKKVAKAELIKVGEMLGVKILKLAD